MKDAMMRFGGEKNEKDGEKAGSESGVRAGGGKSAFADDKKNERRSSKKHYAARDVRFLCYDVEMMIKKKRMTAKNKK